MNQRFKENFTHSTTSLATARIRRDNERMEESLTLNLEHQDALRQGQSVTVVEKATQMACVVVRADVFERIRKLLPDFDPREAYSALDEVMQEDWNDPKMAEYDDYEVRKK